MSMRPPQKSEELLRVEAVGDRINVIIDDRLVAMFPMSVYSQVIFLVESVNRAIGERSKQ